MPKRRFIYTTIKLHLNNKRIQHHPTLLNPTLLEEVAKRIQHVGFNNWGREVWVQNLARILRKQMFVKKWSRSTLKRCLAALALLEMLVEEDDGVTKRGKTRHWIKRRGEKGYNSNSCSRKVNSNSTIPRERRNLLIPKFPASYFERGDGLHCGWSLQSRCQISWPVWI